MSNKIEQLIEYNIQDVVKMIIEGQGQSLTKAMESFYSSKTYEGLSDPDTGLYLQSPSYLYEIFLDETRPAN